MNSGGTTAGTHAGGVRWGQGWETGTATVNDGNWHFVVLTCNNGVKAQYVDGALDALTVNGWSGTGTATQVRIGGTADSGDGNAALNGLIDEVYIYNRTLSQAEVQQLYNNNNSQVLPTNTTVNVASGTLDVGGLTQQIGALTGSGNVVLDDISGSPGSLTVGNAGNMEFDGSISDNSGAGSLTKVGSGTLLLTGANSYSGTTTVSNGTLLVNGSLYGPVTVASGANLGGLGTLNGVVTVNGSLSAGSNSILGQLNFFNNLTLAPGSIASFGLTTSAAGVNDQAVIYGRLTGNNNVIHISAPSAAVDLDTQDYVLMDVSSGTGITGGFLSTPVWDVKPLNYQNYTIQNNGSGQIVLHYAVALAPTATITASPSTVTRNQGSLITVTVTPGSNPINTVTLDTSAIGGSSTLALNQVGSTYVYTNTIAVPSSYGPGTYSFLATVTDSVSLQGTAGTNLTVTLANDIWTGAGTDNNWDTNPNWINSAAPGYVGDSVTFAGTTNLSPNMDQSYIVTSVTFSNNAGSFNIGTSGSTLTLTNGSTIVNNSTNGQTVNVPLVFATAGTVNAAAGNLTLANTIDNGGYTLTVAGATNTSISGDISDAGGLIKTGTGTLVLGGNNSYAGTTTVNGGSLAVTNGNSLTNSLLVANGTLVLTNAGIINIGAATFSAGNVIPPVLAIGSAANQNGAFYQSAGTTINVTNVNLGALAVGSATNDYGYYHLSGGTVNLGGEISVAGPGGGSGTFGQFDMSGGAINLPNSTATYFLANRGAVGESSVVNLSGGTVQVLNSTNPADNGINGMAISWGGGQQTNVTTISGSAQFLTPSLRVKLNEGTSYNGLGNGGSANVTTLNLNGGLLQTLGFLNGAAGANPNVNINFNGGTLKAGTTGNANFLSGLAGAYVYSGGATIDDNGMAITNGQALLAPAGNGITSIAVATPGAGYLVPPQVIITDANGSNATAYATISGGAVTGITVTSPGSGYSSSPTVILAGGGYATAATVGTVATAANVSGGLTKLNTGSLTLTGASTYTGNTVISNGILALGVGGSIGNSANINVTGGATFDVSAISFTLNSGQTLEGNGTVNGSVTNNGTILPGVPGSLGALTFNNNLTLQSSGITSVKLNKTLSPAATNDQIIVSGAANYGGTLAVNNLAGTLALGNQFQLFSAGSYSGNFTGITGLPGAGLAYSFNPASGVLSVVTGSTAFSGTIKFTGSPVVSGTSLAISATNSGSGTIYLLTSTNLANPINTWVPIWTNVLSGSGSFTTNLPNAVNPALKQQFYILSNTNN